MVGTKASARRPAPLAACLAGLLLASPALSSAADKKTADKTEAQRGPPGASAAPVAQANPSTPRKGAPHRQVRLTHRAKLYYASAWGVDQLKVTYTASGNLIRFSYRVSDPERAKALSDKGATPYLLGLRSKALLSVPVMDKVGQLRQAATPQVGREYWMVFSNKGNRVKPGDKVNVMIGAFRAEGLVVEGT